jgi:Putative metal-binding motif
VFDADCPAGLRCVNQVCGVLDDRDSGQPIYQRQFGERCDAGSTCASGLCVGGPAGSFCSSRCDAGCPSAYACKEVPDAGQACAVNEFLDCNACTSDLDCGGSGADQCLGEDAGRFCARDCTHSSCPMGFTCNAAKQCAPTSGSCACLPTTVGQARACSNLNLFGRCPGVQVCGADGGYSACSARAPLPEVCNGLDDDCSGRADDLPPEACTQSNDAGTCTGFFVCKDGGATCDARTPQPERCNFSDDDCDGLTDEPYRDDAGRYSGVAHCGGCGNDCAALVPHATATACVTQGTTTSCRAAACEAGWYVHDGGACQQLADSLCVPCAADSDCLGPGSRCVDAVGEKFCARDCGPLSPFPACPAGYACAAQDGGGSQCVPQSGTCLCTAARLGTVRGCRVSTCFGYQQCAAGPAWTTCDVASFNTEICDALDNNCDGRVDEGFRNPVNGRYDSPQSCGFCNNDCTRIWSLTLQHTQGICDDTGPSPLCRMGPCATETIGATTYQWVDVNGLPADGCECRRDAAALLTDLPDRLPGATPSDSYLDENCDGLDGVVGDALFVWEKAAPLGDGSRARPFQTIGAALVALPSSGKRYVLVAEGQYRENVLLFSGAQLFGGYTVDFGSREPRIYQSVIVGQAPAASASGPLAAVHAQGLAGATPETVLAGFTIQGWDAPQNPPDDTPGAPSYAVYFSDCGPGLVLSDNDISAGRGGAGGRGSTGSQGSGRQSSTALDGRAGLSAGRVNNGVCPSGFHRDGGLGGVNSACGATAARGGDVVCPFIEFDAGLPDGGPLPNEQEYPVDGGGLNGRGGWDWSFHPLGGFGCNRASTHGNDHDGRDGLAGSDGLPGLGGSGAPAPARHGSVLGNAWVPSGLTASAGVVGGSGVPGGGGGAGGGTVRAPTASCPAWEWGATGGGGGAGACGGSGGSPGRAGGASIALFIASSSAASAAQSPQVRGNRLARSFGGEGGAGGFGGAGGLGGRGGNGGQPATWSSSTGGKGGEGGNGAMGGGGGGGAGGPSFGVFAFNVDVLPWTATNTFVAGGDTAGKGGTGGSSAGPGSTGAAGAAGASGDFVSLRACVPSCPGGTSCDGNGVCVPN